MWQSQSCRGAPDPQAWASSVHSCSSTHITQHTLAPQTTHHTQEMLLGADMQRRAYICASTNPQIGLRRHPLAWIEVRGSAPQCANTYTTIFTFTYTDAHTHKYLITPNLNTQMYPVYVQNTYTCKYLLIYTRLKNIPHYASTNTPLMYQQTHRLRYTQAHIHTHTTCTPTGQPLG